MKVIKLTRGYETIVDDEDYAYLSQFKWYAQPKGDGRVYAARISKRTYPYEKRHTIRMNREILQFPEGKMVDHINRNTLDNRRSNLRVATHAENMRNRTIQKNNKHGSPGLTYDPRNTNRHWRVTIRIGEKRPKFIGSYATKMEAAQAYKDAQKKYHGEFAPC